MHSYKTGTSVAQIIEDGWARDFKISQTLDELAEMGHILRASDVQLEWDILDDRMKNYYDALDKAKEEEERINAD